MRVLLDTNIIIYRENKKMTNYSIGHLFRWLDKLKCDKVIHPLSRQEIGSYKYQDPAEAMTLKLDAYEELRTQAPMNQELVEYSARYDLNESDKVDTRLLNEVMQQRVDILITEDKKLREKAKVLGLEHRVLSINSFISLATNQNPALVEYKALSVVSKVIGAINLEDEFFDSLRDSYSGFNNWMNKKANEDAYICEDDMGTLVGFLYLKSENDDENYVDIVPPFMPKKRLKVGTFKVDATGFRLGERFIKIIFDNALERDVDEIYVTLFEDSPELQRLSELFVRWGFIDFGKKTSTGERVLVKEMKTYISSRTPKQNYPNLLYHNKQKFILPIRAEYHTSLLPDSMLANENEIDFLGQHAHKYALQKVYVSWSDERNIDPGDLVIFYRMGDTVPKKYSSVVTTLCMVDEIHYDFCSKEDFFKHCQNRSVFSNSELEQFWQKNGPNLMVLKFVLVKNFSKRPNLEFLWNENIISAPNGPRPFTRVSDEAFDMILNGAETEMGKYWRDINGGNIIVNQT